MCGISAIIGKGWTKRQLTRMVSSQSHRGPDDQGIYIQEGEEQSIGLGHNRLSIIDISNVANQPMSNGDGLTIVFNGELYNYLELRSILGDYTYKTKSDTEVILAAYEKWGVDCLDYFIGMFAFVLWDDRKKRLFVARDRFGVKPLYYAYKDNYILFSSEIKALFAAGFEKEQELSSWATYLRFGLYEHGEKTFWKGVHSLPAGHAITWQNKKCFFWSWYDLNTKIDQNDSRSIQLVKDEYLSLLHESIKLRFRSDVPVGINLSGGLDSSILLSLVDRLHGSDNDISVFTFATNDERYDELPWVSQMLKNSQHPHEICILRPEEIPNLANEIQTFEDEPFGGFPTIAYSKIFKRAQQLGIKVLLDGQGLDEQWAGYDYYAKSLNSPNNEVKNIVTGSVQGSTSKSVQPESLTPEFRNLAAVEVMQHDFKSALRNLQYRDAKFSKIPRALRFNDRVSMMYSTELREPFLDHRLFELALIQNDDRKIRDGVHKWLLREIAGDIIPKRVSHAPKRPLQTPQREWLRGPLADWAHEHINYVATEYGGQWFQPEKIIQLWDHFRDGKSDNSFYIWQWINLSIMSNYNHNGPKP